VTRRHWAIAVFSLAVHLWGLTAPLLDHHAWRQTQTASMARNYATQGMRFLEPMLDYQGPPVRAGTEFPAYSYLLACAYRLFGVHEALGRLLASAFAAWGALFLYGFVRRRLGDSIGLASALVLCVLPVHLYFTRTVQPESMALWALLGFLYCWDRWLRDRGAATLALALALACLGPLLKLAYLYLVLPIGLALAWEHRGWRRAAAPCAVLALAVLAPAWAWYQYARTAPVQVLPLDASFQLEALRSATQLWFYRNLILYRLPTLCATFAGTALAGVGAWALWLRLRTGGARGIAFLVSWLVATALYLILMGKYGVHHEYTMLPAEPVIATFIGAGIWFCWERTARVQWLKPTVIALVLAIPLQSGLFVERWYRLGQTYLLSAGEAFQRISRPEDLVLTNSRELPTALYHLNRYGYSMDLASRDMEAVDAYLARGVRYLLTPTSGAWSEHPEWAGYLAERGAVVHRDREFLIFRFP